MEYERRPRVKDDFEVYGLNKWGNDDTMYGDGKDFKMIMDEHVYMEQNKSFIFGLY